MPRKRKHTIVDNVQNRRKRLLSYAAMGAQIAALGAKALQDATLELPDDISLDELRSIIRAELCERWPGYWLYDVYATTLLCRDWSHDGNPMYSIPYTITSKDNGEVEIELGTPVKARLVPKVIADRAQANFAIPMIIKDAAAIADGTSAAKPLRFQLPGPAGNNINANLRLDPIEVLADAVDRLSQPLTDRTLVSYMGHPRDYEGGDGETHWETEMGKTAAVIVDWTLGDDGRSKVTYEIIPTAAGRDLQALVESQVPVGTSLRALGMTDSADWQGRGIEVSRWMDIKGIDFVTNPADIGVVATPVIIADASVNRYMIASSTPRLAKPVGELKPLEDNAMPNPNADKPTTNQPAAPPPSTQATTSHAPVIAAPPASQAPITAVADNVAPATQPVTQPATQPVAPATAQPVTDAVPPAQPAQTQPAATTGTTIEVPVGQRPVLLDEATYARFTGMLEREANDASTARVKKFVDAVRAGEPVVDPAVANAQPEAMDLSRFDPETTRRILDHCAKSTPDNVMRDLRSAVALADSLVVPGRLAGLGYSTPTGSSAAGETTSSRVEILNESTPFAVHKKALSDEIDRIAAELGQSGRRALHTPEYWNNLAKLNRPFSDAVIGGDISQNPKNRVCHDRARTFLDDAATTLNMLNQPYITPATAALIEQIYWQLEWMQIVSGIGPTGFNTAPGGVVAFGNNLRVMVQSRPSGQRRLFVGEGKPIDTIRVQPRWLNFSAQWLKTAFEITPEAQRELEAGPGRYNVLARNLFMLSQVFAENIDLLLAEEHYAAADEYGAIVVTGETYDPDDLITDAGDLTDMGYGASVVAAIKVKSTFTTATGTWVRPIAKPRHVEVIQEDGSVQPQLNTITNEVTVTLSAAAKKRGVLDIDRNIIPDDDIDADVAHFAVDYENGTIVFNADAGTIDATHLPTITYSKVMNFAAFDLGMSANVPYEHLPRFYDGLLRMISGEANKMGSYPRFAPPTNAIFTMENSSYAEAAASLNPLQQPSGQQLSITAPRPGGFGERGGISYMKMNTPLSIGNGRILLAPNGATRYAVQEPWQVRGPHQKEAVVSAGGGKYVTKPMDQEFYIGRQNSLICTPVAYDVIDSVVVQHNHPYRTIKLVGTPRL